MAGDIEFTGTQKEWDELVKKNNIESVNHALKCFKQGLTDKELKCSWIANIAMAYIDCERWYREKNNKVGKYLNKKDKHTIANNAGEYFTNLLIR